VKEVRERSQCSWRIPVRRVEADWSWVTWGLEISSVFVVRKRDTPRSHLGTTKRQNKLGGEGTFVKERGKCSGGVTKGGQGGGHRQSFQKKNGGNKAIWERSRCQKGSNQYGRREV